MMNLSLKALFKLKWLFVTSLSIFVFSPMIFGAQTTCDNLFAAVNSAKEQKMRPDQDYSGIQKQARYDKRLIRIEVDPTTNETYVLTERSDEDNGSLDYTGHILHVIKKYPIFAKQIKMSIVNESVLVDGKKVLKRFSKILAIPDFNKNLDDLSQKGYSVPSVRLVGQERPMTSTGAKMNPLKDEFMIEVFSRKLMGIDMSGHSYAHDYGQHLVGELLIPEAYRSVNGKMSKAIFLIASHISDAKNPFPSNSSYYRYFESQRQKLWSLPAVDRAAPEFSDLYKVELDIMNTYEWYTYLVQLDIIGSREYGKPMSVESRIDLYLSKDVLYERLLKIRSFLARDPVFGGSEINQLLEKIEHDLISYPSAATMAAEVARTLGGMN